MKKTFKRVICLALVVAFVLSLTGCAKINYITNGTITAIQEVKSGDYLNTDDETDATASADSDPVLIDELVPGTYGGVDFNSLEDVANYYVEAYNYTKTLTAEYICEDGSTATYYKLLGDEVLSIGDVYIDGKANSVINSLVPGIVDGLMSYNTYGLVPCNNRNPELDNNSDDDTRKADHDFQTSGVTVDDILAANVVDNGDGTITMTIQPKSGSMSTRGDDSQGVFFEVLGDIGGTVASISVISFTQGTAEENVTVTYKGGTVVCTIDTSTGEITEADYTMIAEVAVTHATVTVIKDKSASLQITYTNHYPASDEYLMDTKGLTRA